MQLVITYKDQVSTTSLLVAEKFEKRHDDVLKAIRNLECSDEFRSRNFAVSSYKSQQNRDLPMVILSRDGFTMLVMSFSGGKAAKFREEFIDEFNRMEAILRQGQTPKLIPVYQKRILDEPTKSCPHTHWCVFDQSHKVMLLIEKYIGSINQYDIVDGSIGSRWAVYRKDKPWARDYEYYTHEYKDSRGSRESKCYLNSELEHFKAWLHEIYIPEHLPVYLQNKYAKERNVVMLDKVNENLPRLLAS